MFEEVYVEHKERKMSARILRADMVLHWLITAVYLEIPPYIYAVSAPNCSPISNCPEVCGQFLLTLCCRKRVNFPKWIHKNILRILVIQRNTKNWNSCIKG